jgi:long-chain fatty acid transport protein
LGSATWFGWSSFDEIRVVSDANTTITNTEQDYQDTIAIAIGAEYEHNDKWTFRAGYQFDETPTTDEFRTSRTPDGDRNWFTAGATYNINERMSFDVGAAYIDVGDETINLSRNAGLSNIQADTDGYVGILSAGINYKF